MIRVFAVCVMMTSFGAWAASIGGRVTDASGARIVSAQVKALDSATGRELQTVSSSEGIYEFPALQPGTYTLTFTAARFASSSSKPLDLRSGERLRLDAVLELEAAQTQVVVLDQIEARTESTTQNTVLGAAAIQDLPSVGRQLQNLAQLAPGVSGGWNLSTASNRYGKARENTEGAFTVNGARSRSNSFLVDGNPMNLRQYSVINFEPSNEAVAEFEVKTGAPPAEFGGATGGYAVVVTRGGTNALRGGLYEFFRNDVLDANNTFNNRAGLPRGVVRQNQFGGSLGGPVIRNRTFFFVNTEILRNIESSESRLTSVPTADERLGRLRYRDAAGQLRTLDLGQQATPIGRRLIELYPAPNTSGSLNYNTGLPINLNDHQYTIRGDHTLSEKLAGFVRFSRNVNDQTYVINRFGGPLVPGFSLVNPEKTMNGVLSYIWTPRPSLTYQSRTGFNRYTNDLGNGDGLNAAPFGIPNGSDANGIPNITFAAGNLETLGGLPWFNRIQNETSYFSAYNLSWVKGRHTWQFGGEFSTFHYNTRGAFDQRGSLGFDGSRNGVIPLTPENARSAALADLLLGRPYVATITTGQFGRGFRQTVWSGFAQDTWRVTRALTLTYGLRYEYGAPWTEVNGKLSNFVPGLGLRVVGEPGLDRFYEPDRNNVSPRFGFAYSPGKDGRTVIRGGFALLYDLHLQASTVQPVEDNAPFSASAVTFSPVPFPAGSGDARTLLELRSQAVPARSLAAVPLDLRNPYTTQWNLSVQRQVASGWFAEVGGVYARGLNLPGNLNLNQAQTSRLNATQRQQLLGDVARQGPFAALAPYRPYPEFDAINLYANTAQSTFTALQTKLERRSSSGLNLLLGYTWSKSIDNASDFASGDPSERVLNSLDLAAQRGVSSFDVTHRLTGAASYELPGFGQAPLSGWLVQSVFTFQGGQPFTPFTSRFDPFRNEGFNRLDLVGDPFANVPAGQAYNAAAFREPELGRFGTTGRNIVRGGAFRNVNLSLFRRFQLTERLRLEVRAEAWNALNTVNYQGPAVNQAGAAGQFVASAPARQVQFGAKIAF